MKQKNRSKKKTRKKVRKKKIIRKSRKNTSKIIFKKIKSIKISKQLKQLKKLNLLLKGKKKQIIDNKTNINHLNHSCSSNQIYKGVLTDNAKASYLSKTFVDKQAQKTDGYQLSKGILLSDDAYFHSKPELKIYADDVKCSHGSTIGPIDEQLIYYIRSRGINKKEATNILIKSFINDNLEKLKIVQSIYRVKFSG